MKDWDDEPEQVAPKGNNYEKNQKARKAKKAADADENDDESQQSGDDRSLGVDSIGEPGEDEADNDKKVLA